MADTASKVEKVKKNRSAAYPSTSLVDAVEQLRRIHNDLGKGPYDRVSAAKSLGHTGVSGASASKIAALVHYGLVQRVGGGYVETDLGTNIVLPVDHEEETKALLDAFRSPALFAKLLTDFGGKSLPAKLEVILVRQYRITEQASKDVAKVFRESAEFVGILKNGFLSTDVVPATSPDDTTSSQSRNNSVQSPNLPSSTYKTVSDEISIEVGPGLKVVFSPDLMLQVATGKFSKGIKQLSEDLVALTPQGLSGDKVASNEDVKS